MVRPAPGDLERPSERRGQSSTAGDTDTESPPPLMHRCKSRWPKGLASYGEAFLLLPQPPVMGITPDRREGITAYPTSQ